MMRECEMIRVFALKTCDTCRRALAELRAAGHDVEVVDVRADGLSPEEIGEFHAAFGAALVNRRSNTWRGLSDEQRQRDPRALLADFPTLMKRPVIRARGRLFLGWGAETKKALLG